MKNLRNWLPQLVIARLKDVDGYLLTCSLNRKYIVKVRPFSSAKTSDMEYYITPTIIYFMLVQMIVGIQLSFQILYHVAIAKKKRRKQLTNYWSTSVNKKKYLW